MNKSVKPFLEGMKSLMWPGLSAVRQKLVRAADETIEEALAADWQAVGNDIRKAIKRFGEEGVSQQNKPITRKIADLPSTCQDKQHDPPKHRDLDPGIWEHECPSCGKISTFWVMK